MTDQLPVDFVDYEDRVNMRMGPRFTFETDRSREFVSGVPGVRGHYFSDGLTAQVTSSRPAVVTGQRTAPVTCPPNRGTPAGMYTVHSDGDSAGSLYEPPQRYQRSTGQHSTTYDRGNGYPSGRPLSAGQPPAVDNVPPASVAEPSTEKATAADMAARRHIANVGVKLGTYDGNSCLETFLASLRNFATYFKWNEEDELFHLRASLKGPAG